MNNRNTPKSRYKLDGIVAISVFILTIATLIVTLSAFAWKKLKRASRSNRVRRELFIVPRPRPPQNHEIEPIVIDRGDKVSAPEPSLQQASKKPSKSKANKKKEKPEAPLFSALPAEKHPEKAQPKPEPKPQKKLDVLPDTDTPFFPSTPTQACTEAWHLNAPLQELATPPVTNDITFDAQGISPPAAAEKPKIISPDLSDPAPVRVVPSALPVEIIAPVSLASPSKFFANPCLEAKIKLTKAALYLTNCDLINNIPEGLRHFYPLVKTMAFTFNFIRFIRARNLLQNVRQDKVTLDVLHISRINSQGELPDVPLIHHSQLQLKAWLASSVVELVKRHTVSHFESNDLRKLRRSIEANSLKVDVSQEILKLPISIYLSPTIKIHDQHVAAQNNMSNDKFILWVATQIIPLINLLNEVHQFFDTWEFKQFFEPDELKATLMMIILVLGDYCSDSRLENLHKNTLPYNDKVSDLALALRQCTQLRKELVQNIYGPEESQVNKFLLALRFLNRDCLDLRNNAFLSFLQPTKQAIISSVIGKRNELQVNPSDIPSPRRT